MSNMVYFWAYGDDTGENFVGKEGHTIQDFVEFGIEEFKDFVAKYDIRDRVTKNQIDNFESLEKLKSREFDNLKDAIEELEFEASRLLSDQSDLAFDPEDFGIFSYDSESGQ